MTRRLACTAVLVAFLIRPAQAHDPINPSVTWTGDIQRLVHARCVGCHAPDGRGPMPLTTYEEARPWAKAIREEVITRRMPKWHAARGYGQFANDRSLTPFEIALIVAWVDGGAAKSPQPARGDGLPTVALNDAPGPPSPKAMAGNLRLQTSAKVGVKRGEAAPPSASERGWGPASTEKSGENLRASRLLTLPCGNQAITGTLVAVTPRLEPGASAGISVRFPDGRREIVAWIRDFDPEFADTYWLRTPLVMPAGSRLVVDASGTCSIDVGLKPSTTARRSQTMR